MRPDRSLAGFSPGESALKFPKPFYFFSHILRHDIRLSYLTYFMLFLSYVQKLAFSFFPILIYHMHEGTSAVSTEILYSLIRFTTHEPNSIYNDSAYLALYYIEQSSNIIIIGSFFLFYFSHHFNPNVLCILRAIVAYLNIILLLPTFLDFGGYISMFINGNDQYLTMRGPIASLTYFFMFIIFSEHFLRPICSDTPILGSSIYPSEMIPSFTFHTYPIIMGIIGCVCYVIADEYSALFFCILSFVVSLYYIIDRWRHPFFSNGQTAGNIASLTALAVNPILSVINFYTNFLSEELLIVIFSAFSLVYLFLCRWLIDRKEKHIIELIRDSKLSPLGSEDLIYAAQVACSTRNITEDLLNNLKRSIAETSDNDVWIIYLYCNLVLERPIPDELPLFDIPSLSWSRRYILFELICSYSQTNARDPSPDDQMEIQSKINEYKKDADIFWSFLLLGKTSDALGIVARLYRTYRDSSFEFSCLASFFPYNKFIIDTDSEFFHSEIIRDDFNFETSFSKGKKSEIVKRYQAYFHVTPSRNADSTTSDQNIIEESNRKSEADKVSKAIKEIGGIHLPKLMPYLLILYFLFMAVYLVFLVRGPLTLFAQMNQVDTIPNLLILTHNMTNNWESINLAIGHITNCTNYVTSSCSANMDSFSEPNATCVTISDLIYELFNITESLVNNIRTFSNEFSSLADETSYESFVASWYSPTIEYSIGNTTTFTSTKVDPVSILKYFSLRVIEYLQGDTTDICDSRLKDYMQRFGMAYFKLVSETEANMLQSLSLSANFISDMRTAQIESKSGFSLIIIFLCAILGILCLSGAYIYTAFEINKMLSKNFIISKHPTNGTIRGEIEKEKFKMARPSASTEIGNIVYFLIYTLTIGFYTHALIMKNFNTLRNESNGICSIQNISLISGILVSNILHEWQFNQTTPFISNEIIGVKALFDKLGSAFYLMNPESLFADDDVSLITSYYPNCNISGEYSVHDTYVCVNTFQQVTNAFFFYSKLQTSGVYDINQSAFAHLQHLYTSHLVTSLKSVNNDVYEYAVADCRNLRLLCTWNLRMFMNSLAAFLIISIYAYQVLRMFSDQLERVLQIQNPRFIASEPGLMQFVSAADENKIDSTTFNSLLSLYQNTRMALIIVSDRLTIISFTDKVKSLFGYPSELLIGQNLELLFPQRRCTDLHFFGLLKQVLSRQSESHFTRKVNGRMSSGEDLPVLIEASLLEVEEKDQILIEMRSLLEMTNYEDDIHRHTLVLGDLESSSLPLTFFPDYNSETSGAFLQYFILVIVHDSYSDLHSIAGYDYKVEVDRILFTHQYLGGAHRSAVIDSSASHAIVVFGGSVEEKEPVRLEAMQFIAQMPGHSVKEESYAMIEGTNLKMQVFPPPEVPSEFIISEMPLNIAANMIPTVTTETQSQIVSAYPELMRLLKPGLMCSTRELAQYYGFKAANNAGIVCGKNLVYSDLDCLIDLKEQYRLAAGSDIPSG